MRGSVVEADTDPLASTIDSTQRLVSVSTTTKLISECVDPRNAQERGGGLNCALQNI